MIIRIGFENTSYTVDESVGSQEICVRIFVDDNIELPVLGDGLFVAVATVAGTAGEFFIYHTHSSVSIFHNTQILQMRPTIQGSIHCLALWS